MLYATINETDFFGLGKKSYLVNPRVWRNVQEIPADVKYLIENYMAVEFGKCDYLTPISKGKHWLLELTLKFQPRTGRILLDSDGLWLRSNESSCGPQLHMGISIDNKVIIFQRDGIGYNFSDEKMAKFIPALDRYLCLPEPIRLAYYNRFNGLKIPDSPAPGIFGRLLPNSNGEWRSWDRYLEEFKGYKKLYLPWLVDRIESVAPKRKSATWTNFMLFLDSRPDNKGIEGDQLFVKTHIHDGLIYHIKDADIKNMRILADPTEAIDRYMRTCFVRKRRQI